MKLIIIVLLFIPIIIFGQNSHEVYLTITDTVIIKNNYPYATKVNLEINAPDLQDTYILYSFRKCVGSMDFYERNDNMKAFMRNMGISIPSTIIFPGLTYIVEDEKQQKINTYPYFSLLYKYPITDPRNENIGIFVNSNQKIIRKKLNDKKINDYNLARYKITRQNTSTTLYLLLSVYHNDLPKGEYYLYLGYSFNPSPQYVLQGVANDNKTFRGTVVSNKVKLIVK